MTVKKENIGLFLDCYHTVTSKAIDEVGALGARLLCALGNIGYDGNITIERECAVHPEQDLALCYKTLCEIIETKVQ